MMLHRMSAYHNRQILCSARLAYSVYYTVRHHIQVVGFFYTSPPQARHKSLHINELQFWHISCFIRLGYLKASFKGKIK